jgi:precorrin-6B methylase 2
MTQGGTAMTIKSPTPNHILELGQAFRGAKALLSAVELDVFTLLADGPRELEDLSAQLGLNARGARDFLDALVALGMLVRPHNGRYGNSAETDLYLDRNKPTYVGGALESSNTRLYGLWGSLTTALRTGRPQCEMSAAGNFAPLYADEMLGQAFVSSMTAQTRPVAKALAIKFPWHDRSTLIDIGAAEGCLPVEIALAHPHITGGGFDLAPLEAIFNRYVSEHGLANRLRFYPGDFFKRPLPTADVLVLGRVLHNWDLATKKMLLKKAYDALPPAGTLIVYERLLDDERCVNAVALLSSLNMLLTSTGGFEFTGAECIGWMQETGFRRIHIEPLTADQSMVLGVK